MIAGGKVFINIDFQENEDMPLLHEALNYRFTIKPRISVM